MQNNTMQMLQMFKQFQTNFQGDPRAKVEELMRSGQMTQQQFNHLQSQATTFMNMFGIK